MVVNFKLEKWLNRGSVSTGSAPKSIPAKVMLDSPTANKGAVGNGVVPVVRTARAKELISWPPMSLTMFTPRWLHALWPQLKWWALTFVVLMSFANLF